MSLPVHVFAARKCWRDRSTRQATSICETVTKHLRRPTFGLSQSVRRTLETHGTGPDPDRTGYTQRAGRGRATLLASAVCAVVACSVRVTRADLFANKTFLTFSQNVLGRQGPAHKGAYREDDRCIPALSICERSQPTHKRAPGPAQRAREDRTLPPGEGGPCYLRLRCRSDDSVSCPGADR